MSNPKFKKGDQVVMHSCYESELEEYKGKVWTIKSDSYMTKWGEECVFLEGFFGCFDCKYLTIVKS
ncbi:hypothetical protein FCL53_17050 [Elizabethkingia meningoseptica]|nr:hypothetical protein [Elizabethkingia meningoseptica]